jgi:hypothetical protein
MEGRAVGYNFETDPPKDHPCQVWCNLVQRFQRKRFKCGEYFELLAPLDRNNGAHQNYISANLGRKRK